MKKNILSLLLFIFIYVGLQAQDLKKDTTCIIKNVQGINDKYSNFGASYFKDKQLLFSSPKKSKIIKDIWEVNNTSFLDLYIGDIIQTDSIQNIKLIRKKANSPYNEAMVCFSKDFKKVYFTRNNYKNFKLKKDSKGQTNLGIYIADVASNNKWVNAIPFQYNNIEYSVGHPTLSKDGKTLYFSSNMPGGYGKTDIYKVAILKDGSFGEPINLGATINSNSEDFFPFIDENNILYFSSNRSGGLGKLDIYFTELDKSNPPLINLKALNSNADDFAFIKKRGSNEGYFSSNRTGGKGDDDVYAFEFIIKEKDIIIPCTQIVSGKTYNTVTQKVIKNVTLKVFNAKNETIKKLASDKEGYYHIELPCSSTFKIISSKDNYEDNSVELTTSNKDLAIKKDIHLKPVNDSKEYDYSSQDTEKLIIKDINNIHFSYNQYTIRKDAKFELDKIIALLNKNNDVIISISAYTDSRGSSMYNQSLSQRRADAIKEYLIFNGISVSRIIAIGYGENHILNRCFNNTKCSDLEHEVNRRAEFIFYKKIAP
jgi:outer membrane protein OmpA-like peptidoglycan-associated protein